MGLQLFRDTATYVDTNRVEMENAAVRCIGVLVNEFEQKTIIRQVLQSTIDLSQKHQKVLELLDWHKKFTTK